MATTTVTATTSVTLAYTTTTDLFQVQINGKRVRFRKRKANVKLAGGKNHLLQWFVRGAPGSKYALEITAPKPAQFKHEARLDADRMDAGHTWFPA